MMFYARLAFFNFSTYLAYPVEFLSASLRPVFDLGFRLLFWAVVARSAQETVNFHHIVAYFLLVAGVGSITLFEGMRFSQVLSRAVKSGELNNALIKPVKVLRYYLASLYGSRGIPTIFGILFFSFGIIIEPPRSLVNIALFTLMLAIAFSVSIGINILLGTIALYWTEASSIKNVVMHLSTVFSGSLIPLNYFPPTLHLLAVCLPFGAVIFGPVQALSVESISTLIPFMISGGIWAIILPIVATRFWQRSLRRYEAIGI